MTAWRARRAALSAAAIDANDTVNMKFAKVQTDRLKALAQLATDAAVKRIKLEAKAKFDQIANTKIAGVDDAKIDKTV